MTDRFHDQGATEAVPSSPDDADDAMRAELSGVLARLTGPVAADHYGRLLAPAPGEDQLSALLQDIDSTVMARCLRVQNGEGVVLCLEVSNRRLLHVSCAGDDATDVSVLPRGGIGALGFAGVEDLARLKAAFEQVCAAGEVRVRSLPPTGQVSVEQTGVSVATLREAFATTAAAPETQTRRGDAAQATLQASAVADATAEAARSAASSAAQEADAAYRASLAASITQTMSAPTMMKFAQACGDDVLCWQVATGESMGPSEHQAALEKVWDEWPEGLLATSEDPVLTLLSAETGAAGALLLGQAGDDALVMLIRPEREERVFSVWIALQTRSRGR